MIGNIREFITDAFDYKNILTEASVDRSVNAYLLEHIANGFVKYGSVEGFIEHIDDWIRNIIGIFPELGFDHESHQILATIDLHDQVVVLDMDLMQQLSYVIRIQQKYGLLITYTTADHVSKTTTLLQFFEAIEKLQCKIITRFKGLGSSEADASREVIMDPRTRRISQVTMADIERTKEQMDVLVGDRGVNQRKELLMNFHFTSADIDT